MGPGPLPAGRSVIVTMVSPVGLAHFDRVIELKSGRVIFDGTPAQWPDRKSLRLAAPPDELPDEPPNASGGQLAQDTIVVSLSAATLDRIKARWPRMTALELTVLVVSSGAVLVICPKTGPPSGWFGYLRVWSVGVWVGVWAGV